MVSRSRTSPSRFANRARGGYSGGSGRLRTTRRWKSQDTGPEGPPRRAARPFETVDAGWARPGRKEQRLARRTAAGRMGTSGSTGQYRGPGGGLLDAGGVGQVQEGHGPGHLAHTVLGRIGIGDAAALQGLVVEVAVAAEVEAEGSLLDPVRVDAVAGR